MKQKFFLMLAALLTATAMSAQTETTEGRKGDLNGDNRLDIADVVVLLEMIANDNGTQQSDNGTQTFTVNGVDFKMVSVEGGTFQMGATEEQGSDAFDEEKPVHEVTLSSYCIGQTEVTQELWQAVMGKSPSDDAQWTATIGMGGQYPVYYVRWEDCQTFIARLNLLTGQNFRLPTEAEWEYAARGGAKSKGNKFAGSDTASDVAWYKGNSGNSTHKVGTLQPNELGLYDMSGNVAEWCADWFNTKYYASSPTDNPTGPTTGKNRISRGGSWTSTESVCRISYRGKNDPMTNARNLGLRLAL